MDIKELAVFQAYPGQALRITAPDLKSWQGRGKAATEKQGEDYERGVAIGSI